MINCIKCGYKLHKWGGFKLATQWKQMKEDLLKKILQYLSKTVTTTRIVFLCWMIIGNFKFALSYMRAEVVADWIKATGVT